MDAYEKRSRARQYICEMQDKGKTLVEIREVAGNKYGVGENFIKKIMREHGEFLQTQAAKVDDPALILESIGVKANE